ncbi:MAG TPA: IS630 family transposase [Candidatus Tectomicrobia bacterium]
MRPYGSQQSLERRRRQALALLAQGIGPREVARRVRAAVGSVYRWHNAWRQGGEAALAAKPVPGAPRKLTDQQRAQLLHLLMHGARANGFPNELWTLKRIAAVIQVHFGVRYHPAHVWKLLRHWGWSCQVPERRALQRDERTIAHWKRSTWPAIKKVQRLGAHLAFLDERGFLLIPTRRRTWAPIGQTPLIPYNDKHDRLSTLAALTVSPKRQHMGRYLHWQPQNFQAVDVAAFLRALLRHLRGPILLLWDRGSMHRGQAIEAVRQAHPRLHVEEFPA